MWLRYQKHHRLAGKRDKIMTIECSVQSKATSVYIRTEFVNVMLVTLTLSSRLTPCLPKRMVHSFFSWTRIIGRVSTHPATEPRLVDWVEQEIVQADWSLHYLCWDRQTTTNHNPHLETAPARRIDQYTWRFCKELLCFSCEVAFSKAAKGLHQTNMGPEPNKRLARTPTGAKLTTWWKPGEILTFQKKKWN